MIPNLAAGGAQRHVVNLCRSVPKDMVQLHIFLTMGGEEDFFLSAARSTGVPVFICSYHRYDPRSLIWLAEQIRKAGIDVMQSFLWRADLRAALATLIVWKVVLVGSERGDRMLSGYNRWRKLLDRLLSFPRSTAFVANSVPGAAALRNAGCNSAKVSIIHNGIDPRWGASAATADLRGEASWPRDSVVVGAVNRIVDYKGVDILIRAISLTRNRARLRCVVVGDGPERERLEALAGELGCGNAIVFAGLQPDPAPFIKGFDIAVLPSFSEGFSNTILEYMACGKPVVATRVGENAQLLVDGETGFLVPSRDPGALAEAIDRLAESPPTRRRMGQAAYERVRTHFGMEETATQFVDLWSAAWGASA